MRSIQALLAAVAVVAVGGLHAAEPYTLHDNFSTPVLNAGKWTALERTRVIRNGALQHVQRDLGDQYANQGARVSYLESRFDEPQRITQIRATVVVGSVDVTGCATNPQPGAAGAGLFGTFFSVGAGTPGTMINDVQAVMFAAREPQDPAGVLTVRAEVVRCISADCVQSQPVAPATPLGTASIGQAVLLEVQWDRPNQRFLFRRDAGTAVPAVYGVQDATPPTSPMKALVTATALANCLGGTRTAGAVEARFDNVSVNASAMAP